MMHLEEGSVSPSLATDPEVSPESERKACRDEVDLLGSFIAVATPFPLNIMQNIRSNPSGWGLKRISLTP